jgi:hypothetical protein
VVAVPGVELYCRTSADLFATTPMCVCLPVPGTGTGNPFPGFTHLSISLLLVVFILLLLSFYPSKMNIEVSLNSSLIKPPVLVRGLLANNSFKTQISRRLAEKLGLNSVREVYVAPSVAIVAGDENIVLKWKISTQPVFFTVKGMDKNVLKVVYPLINSDERDAFWEIIIGQDCQNQWELLNACQTVDRGMQATPGPRHAPNTHFLGHNVKVLNLSDFLNPPNEFFEFPCFESEALSRLAVNKRTNQMVAVFVDSTTVYQYNNVPKRYFIAIQSNASKGITINEVKQVCAFKIIENFPKAVLTNFETVSL